MSFHLSIFDASIANGTTLVQIAALADPVIAPAGTLGFLVNPNLPNIVRIAAVGTNLTRVQLSSGAIRALALYDVGPVNIGTKLESPPRMVDMIEQPFALKPNEELDAFGVQSNAGAQRITVAVTFADGPITPVHGKIWSLHWTATATLVANAFTAFTPTFDNGLPGGTFAVVGSRAMSAGALFHRFIPRGVGTFRPGTYAYQVQDDSAFKADRWGAMGQWFTFQNTGLPQIEIFSRSADTTQEGYLDVIQTG